MALREALLILANSPPRFMNQALHRYFPERTIEAIKRQRRNAVYRDAVQLAVEKLRAADSPSPPSSPESSDTESDTSRSPPSPRLDAEDLDGEDDTLISYMKAMPPPADPGAFGFATLLQIIDGAFRRGKVATLSDLTSYLEGLLPRPRSGPPHRALAGVALEDLSSRKRRKHEYAMVQRNWYKHQSRCIKSILDGENNAMMSPQPIMEGFWRNIFERVSLDSPALRPEWAQELADVWTPISIGDVTDSEPDAITSAGYDGVSARQWRSVAPAIRARIFNLILWCEDVPVSQRLSTTIFIPKKTVSREPGDFRPITIPSIIVRQLNNILARRIQKLLELGPRQRAFRPTDGCADNAILFDLLLRDQHHRYANCHSACLDVSKAFDSVSHRAIFTTMASYGFPHAFRNYIQNIHTKSQTRFKGDGWISNPSSPSVGVKQGDPLSPLLFNLVIDGLLRALPNHIAALIDSTKINALAFADDLVLAASTADGLQDLIDCTEAYLGSCTCPILKP